MIQIAKDVSRSVDFLESRSDIQGGKVAYYGLSAGGTYGPLLLAMEPRLKTGILLAGGLFWTKVPAEIDILNFAPRVRVPVLMLNGLYDFAMPSETFQKPMFRLLGTPERDKRHRQFDTGHLVVLQDVIPEVLNWLDRYLGPVRNPAGFRVAGEGNFTPRCCSHTRENGGTGGGLGLLARGEFASRSSLHERRSIVFALPDPPLHICRVPGEGVPDRPQGCARAYAHYLELVCAGGLLPQKADHL